MNISVVGTGYVGLVTGVCLADIGHDVTCIDIDEAKILKMKEGISPIYELGLEELMIKNINEKRLTFTSNLEEGYLNKDIIYIAVGTPQNTDGSTNLSYIEQVARDIGTYVKNDIIIVTKSTVPVGTNEYVRTLIHRHLLEDLQVQIVSNPEFLREGSAVNDTFYGDRIVIGTENEEIENIMTEVYKPFLIPIYKTDIRSAEMIKYASNAFLATKISFINEISNVCEKLGANVESVAQGMGLDKRIGHQFLNAGIGYGGSCFPKDTNALVQIAGNVDYKFKLLEAVIEVNKLQQGRLVQKALARFGDLTGKRIALLGLSFKPNTDDMREAPSIKVAQELLKLGADVIGYDPIAIKSARKWLPDQVLYANTYEEALNGSDAVFILTEWQEFKEMDLKILKTAMNEPVVFDGRNCYKLEEIKETGIEYYSIGRESLLNESVFV